MNLQIGSSFKSIATSEAFKKAAEYRHAITHRHPPSDFTSGFQFYEGGRSFGIGEYTNCSTVVNIMEGGIEVLKSILSALKAIDS